ncbi:MAG TPA: type II secretion system protein GspG [Blastocatellia bacterium]|nr:type II secretion system protein GspG [Blastocatellia bacterium]
MKSIVRVLALIALALSFLLVAAWAKDLGSREAREKIARALGLEKPDNVHIKSISTGMGGEAIVQAQFEGAFRFTKDAKGEWNAVEVRTGDRRWESIELMQTAIRKEKVLRTTADMRTIVTALESFRRERGFYVAGKTGAVLIDNLSPGFLNSIIRLDAWSREFQYSGTNDSYRLASLGPDGNPDTGDDIVFETGRMVKGMAQ